MGAAVGLHGARLRSSLPWQHCSFVLTPFSRYAPLEETWPFSSLWVAIGGGTAPGVLP